MANPDCPCGTGRRLHLCCGPYLAGTAEPPDAEALMRSRFSAFARGEVEHLWRTLDPEHPDRARPKDEVLAELRKACRTNRYRALQVLDRAPPDAQGLARVLFLARIFQSGHDLSFLECSEFRHDGTGWRYLRGDAQPASRFADPTTLTIGTFPKD